MADLTQYALEKAGNLVRFAPDDGAGLLGSLLIIIALIVLSSLPLYISLKIFFARKVSILRVFLVNIIVGFVISLANYYFEIFGGMVAFILLLIAYKIAFGIGWIRAFLVWLLQFAVLAALMFVLDLAGINLL